MDPAVDYPLYKGFVHLGAGVACGMTGMAAGYAIGHVGDAVSSRYSDSLNSIVHVLSPIARMLTIAW